MAKPPDMDPPGKGNVPTFENSNDVPTIYFDIAPAYGVMSGIVQVELGARILVPHSDDSVDVRFVSSGRLRCSAPAALAGFDRCDLRRRSDCRLRSSP